MCFRITFCAHTRTAAESFKTENHSKKLSASMNKKVSATAATIKNAIFGAIFQWFFFPNFSIEKTKQSKKTKKNNKTTKTTITTTQVSNPSLSGHWFMTVHIPSRIIRLIFVTFNSCKLLCMRLQPEILLISVYKRGEKNHFLNSFLNVRAHFGANENISTNVMMKKILNGKTKTKIWHLTSRNETKIYLLYSNRWNDHFLLAFKTRRSSVYL